MKIWAQIINTPKPFNEKYLMGRKKKILTAEFQLEKEKKRKRKLIWSIEFDILEHIFQNTDIHKHIHTIIYCKITLHACIYTRTHVGKLRFKLSKIAK